MNRAIYLALAAFMATSALAGSYEQKVKNDFESLDNNSDSYVSQQEAQDKNVSSHFSAIDKNGDNRLSAEEFNRFIEENPTAAGKELKNEKEKQGMDSMY